jgi:hypothetical protein
LSANDSFLVLAELGAVKNSDLTVWNAAIGLRNRIVHDYMNIDKARVALTASATSSKICPTFPTGSARCTIANFYSIFRGPVVSGVIPFIRFILVNKRFASKTNQKGNLNSDTGAAASNDCGNVLIIMY